MTFASGDFRFWLQVAAFVALAFAAWRYGAGPERALAGVLLWFPVSDTLNHDLFGRWTNLASINTGHVVIDVVALVAAVAIALAANRIYPLWFAALQLISVFAHLAKDIAHGIAPLAYAFLFVIPSYFQIITLALGIWMHRRRVLRHGTYRSWRSLSSRSPVRSPTSWPGV